MGRPVMSIYLPPSLSRTIPTPLRSRPPSVPHLPSVAPDTPPSPWRPAGVAASGHRRRAAQAEGGAPSRDRAAEEEGGDASRDQVAAAQVVGGAPSTVAAATDDGGGATTPPRSCAMHASDSRLLHRRDPQPRRPPVATAATLPHRSPVHMPPGPPSRRPTGRITKWHHRVRGRSS
jgi:hypothetical protein